ncbi:PREDICTED: mitochondrial antiviral-signaling protein [Acanthisitta chloris]|uniref:mitochondrial antiviral-signaling protein n=1 Tax=Acanthisitta chloris TaxID=57068 RepID=UPI0004F0E7D9|nr:PREDICTED: mitochondrial antiviral-signaling protein [Acanthisitta chloris]
MGFAEDKVYSHILRNLRHFSTIRVASLADSLTCLTDADRDELHAREETRGSQATVYKFYQHLRCRQGWVLDLIHALRLNNAGELADELQDVYDTWRSGPSAATSLPRNPRPAASSSARTPSPGPNPAPGAPLAEMPRRDLPVGVHPPHLPGAATTTSTDLEARAPVQESLPKKLLEPESPQPGSRVRDRASDGHGGEEHLSHPVEAVQVPVGTPGTSSVAMPSAAPPEQGRDWLSRRPVCVDNGCFGNANHLHRGAPGLGLGRSLPQRDAGVSPSPEQPRNEPEENSDVSTESPPRLEEASHGGGLQPPKSLPKKQSVPSSQHRESLGSFVDVHRPLLIQEQFDAEKKLAGMLQEHGGDGDTSTETTTLVTTPVPRDTSLSLDTSMKSPVQEKKLSIGSRTGSTPSMPAKKEVLLASVDPLLGTAVVGSSEGTAGRSASQMSSTNIRTPHSDVGMEVELSKPGALLSLDEGSPEVPGRCLSTQGPSNPHSTVSSSFSLSGDPILMSTDSSSSGAAFPRVSSGFGASRDSCPTPSWDSTSLGTHEVHVDHYPSTQLGSGSNGASALGISPDGDTAAIPARARDPAGDNSGPALPYILPAVGFAVISVVAFLAYTRLQK